MKKIKTLGLIVFLGLLLPAALQARPVSLSEAEQAARAWVARDNPQKTARLTQVDFSLNRVAPLNQQEAVVGYLASLSPQGFIIIPAASELSPIQFISYDATYETVKFHPFLQTIRERLYNNLTQLGYLVPPDFLLSQEKATPDRQQVDLNERAWENLILDRTLSQTIASSMVTPLLTSKWSQSAPYNEWLNNLINDGFYYPTGCSAAALAQVMYYWKYPPSGQGSNSYEWTGGGTLSADFNHTYHWDRMIDDYSSGSTQDQQDAVGELMSDVGRAINMQYATGGSAAQLYTNNAPVTFFKYSPSLITIRRSDFNSTADWFEIFRAQLNSRLVVPLAVYPFTHAVVIDGYRTDNYLSIVHVNIGWGGLYDGYYSLDGIYGGTQGGSGSLMDYALINVYPQGFQPAGPSVSGTVTGYDQLPIKCEKVEFWKEKSPGVFSKVTEAQTDAEGRYFILLTPGNYKVYFNSTTANYSPECKTYGRTFNDEWYKDQTNMITHPELGIDLAQVIQVTASSRHTIDAVLERYCSYPSNVSYFKRDPSTNPGNMIWDYRRYAPWDASYYYYCDSFQIQRATFLDFRDAVEVYRGMPKPYYNMVGTAPGSYYYRIRSLDDSCGVSDWFYSILVEIQQQISNIYLPLIIKD